MPEVRSWREREALIEVSAGIAARDQRGLRRSFRLAAAAAAPSDVDEVILQAHLFVGYPLALEAFRVWREISPARGSGQVEVEVEVDAWAARGEAVCKAVYGSAYEKLVDSVGQLNPELGRLMLEVGYGRVIGRPGLDLVTRELCIAALLAVWRTPRQLHSHLRGALNVGATREQIDAMLNVACRQLLPEEVEEVLRVWAGVRG